MKTPFQIVGTLVLTATVACPAHSQNRENPLIVSLSADQKTFAPKAKVPLRITIDNRTGHTIKTNYVAVSLHLTKFGTDEAKCRRGDCYITSTYWAKTFRNGETREIEVDLATFGWKDLISSVDYGQRNNFYQVIPPGTYYLFMDFPVRIGNSTRSSVTSNLVSITVERKPASAK